MKHLKTSLLVIPFFIMSCANSQYLKNYDPVNVFLNTQNLNNPAKYILQSDKEENLQTLRIFNGGEGEEHLIDPKNSIDYASGLFVEKYWKKMYTEYVHDTVKKYWKKGDFPQYDFILEKGTGLTLKESFIKKYINTGIHEMIILSEPIYYMDKKYIMFYYVKISFENSGIPRVVVMKKEKDKWVVDRIIVDYIYNY